MLECGAIGGSGSNSISREPDPDDHELTLDMRSLAVLALRAELLEYLQGVEGTASPSRFEEILCRSGTRKHTMHQPLGVAASD